MSELDYILDSIPELTKDSFNNNNITIENIINENPCLTIDDPLTYIIYLCRNKDINETDKNKVQKIIAKLTNNNNVFETIVNEKMKPFTNQDDAKCQIVFK